MSILGQQSADIVSRYYARKIMYIRFFLAKRECVWKAFSDNKSSANGVAETQIVIFMKIILFHWVLWVGNRGIVFKWLANIESCSVPFSKSFKSSFEIHIMKKQACFFKISAITVLSENDPSNIQQKDLEWQEQKIRWTIRTHTANLGNKKWINMMPFLKMLSITFITKPVELSICRELL